MSVTQITDDNIDTGIDTSKCIGALGAMDGSALTGLNVGTSLMKNASDPAVDTNPADGVGAIWINTVTGQMFSCTDATTDANVWTNMGSGTGHITFTPPWSYTGNISAHTFGGYIAHYGTLNLYKWNFASNSTASSKGSLCSAGGRGINGTFGISSSTHGYSVGGHCADTGAYQTKIDKVGLASATESCGNPGSVLTTARSQQTGTSSQYAGYAVSGYPNTSVIDKFIYASDNTCSATGNLNTTTHSGHGSSSSTHGYVASGYNFTTSARPQTIQKWSFASGGDSVDVGNISGTARQQGGSCSSALHGYVLGGSDGTSRYSTIDRYLFSNETTTSGHGDLAGIRYGNAGHSSSTEGFSSQGGTAYNGKQNDIHKFSFSSNATAAGHGTVGQSSYLVGGHQY